MGRSSLGLIYIGSCTLHLIHNSFKLSIDGTSWLIDEFLNNLVFWFNRSPSRREDYTNVANAHCHDAGKFINRFIVTRWLEVGPILERAVEQWANLKAYFLVFIPAHNKISMSHFRYTQIKTVLEAASTLIRLHFLIFLYRNIYEQMLVWFQQTQPLVHLLYDECEQMIRRLLPCFVSDCLMKNKALQELMAIPFHSRTNQKSDSSNIFNRLSLLSDGIHLYLSSRTIL